MGRKPRIEYPGGIYHLIQRGNNREYIFRSREDKSYLLEQIEEYRETMGFELYGYVVMGNHYHLVVRVSESPLSDIMHRINNKFSRYYNRKYGRTGHVFENRYKGILVIGDRYLLSLLRYVHQNPVSANMCRSISDYFWSSDGFYRKNDRQGMVDIDHILNIFSDSRVEALKAYIEFMDENKKEEIGAFEEVDVIGSVSLVDLEGYINRDRKSLDSILWEVAGYEKIYDDIRSGSRKRYLTEYKKEFIERAIRANYTMREIGESISISHVAVFRIYENKTGGE